MSYLLSVRILSKLTGSWFDDDKADRGGLTSHVFKNSLFIGQKQKFLKKCQK